jgi:4-hydroxy-tetrahydrodipicolinate synthase
MFDDIKLALASVIGITATPFDDAGALDAAGFRVLVQRASEAGITAFTPNGNTSEYYSLTPDERALAVKITVEEAPGALVLPGVGGDFSSMVAAATDHAALGVRAVMVHQPVHPFWSGPGWVRLHVALAEALPEIALVPYIRSDRITPTLLRNLLDACPQVVGVKYAVADPAQFAACVAEIEPGRVTWVCGLAEMWAPFFGVAGATGFTSGLVSVDPARSLRMLERLRAADYASVMAEWAQIREFEELRARDSSEMNVSVVKQALAELGLCNAAVRPPLAPLGSEDQLVVRRIIREWGLGPVSRATEGAKS